MIPVRPWRTIILTASSLLAAIAACANPAIEDMPAPEARQGVAVDADAVYAIDSRTIGKYDKRTATDRWCADAGLLRDLGQRLEADHWVVG